MRDFHLKYILVVDDDVEYRTMIEKYLAGCGYVCDAVGNASEALERISINTYDVVISDIKMPGKNGIELMQEAMAAYTALAFIIMTGHASDHSYSAIIAAGATDFINKPFEMTKLKSKLERIEREKRLLHELHEANQALKRTEEDLREANDYLENVFENAAEAIGIVDQQGRIKLWNRAAVKLFGFGSEELKGKPFSELYAYPDELEDMLAQLRRDGFVWGYEINIRRKDGSIVPFRISISVLKDKRGNIVGSVGLATDVSSIKKAMTQLQTTNEQLQVEIAERKRAEEGLRKAQDELEKLVAERTAKLSKAGELLKRSIDRFKEIAEE